MLDGIRSLVPGKASGRAVIPPERPLAAKRGHGPIESSPECRSASLGFVSV